MPIAFLLALQASGMVVDWLGRSEQIRTQALGEKAEQAGINSNIALSRLQYEDESLQSMKQLRSNLGTQAAMTAARGARADTSALISNESVGNFNADQRVRTINQLSTQNSLRAGKAISELHAKTARSQIMNEFTTSVLNKIPTSPSAYSNLTKNFGLTKVGS